MENAFLTSPRRIRTQAFTAVGAVAVVLAAAAVLTRGGESNAATTTMTTPAPTATTATALAPSAAPVKAATATPVKLVEGKRRVNGVAVGYPHTQAGAVSAAMEYATQLASTLDPQRAMAIGEAVVDRTAGVPPALLAQGPINSRRRLGLPETGPVPTGASMSLGPVSYQLRDVERDRTTVLLLGYMTTITPAQGLRNSVGVFPVPLVWSDGDWKVVRNPADAPDYSQLRYAPGSSAAVAAGWLPLTA